MLKFEKFRGINNVVPSHRLKPTELEVGLNIDIGLDAEITRREGYSQVSEVCHKNLWQADGFMLATSNHDLVRTDGVTQTVLYPALGSTSRVWYCNLPDGRTTFSNGLINGITDGVTASPWGTKPVEADSYTPGESSDAALIDRSRNLYPMPVGTVTATYHGRVLVAQGKVLWASRPFMYELCDTRFDYKLFSDDITLIQPVDDGVYVGTETELAFLAGATWDDLVYRQVATGRTVLGSGVTVEAEYLKPREGGNNRGTAMIAIADGGIVYGYNGGSIWRVTEGRYRTEVTEVSATWRLLDGVPQYIAVPQ
jgi:hypothetical protein